MSRCPITDRLIPGYSLLTKDDQTTFLERSAGKIFQKACEDLAPSYWGIFLKILPSEEKINERKRQLLSDLKNNVDYTKLKRTIVYNCLQRSWVSFAFMTEEEQCEVVDAIDDLDSLQEFLADAHQRLQDAREKQVVFDQPYLNLNHIEPLVALTPSDLNQGPGPFCAIYDEVEQRLHEVFQETHLPKRLKQRPVSLIIDTLLSEKRTQLPEHSDTPSDNLTPYQAALIHAFEKRVRSPITPLTTRHSNPAKKHNSVSWALNSTPPQEPNEWKSWVNDFANAHAFIQGTGFSTQNESSWLAIVDIYNCWRTRDTLSDAKGKATQFLMPFEPLGQEYWNIATFEKNKLAMVFRCVMPLIIIASTVVAVSFLLSPLVITDFAFLVILVPTLYLGFAAASLYALTKDTLYRNTLSLVCGGPYEIPAFQVNDRVCAAFGDDQELAQTIRDYYIHAIQHCDDLEYDFAARAKLLTVKEQETRQQLIERRRTLILEWYDIHENERFGLDLIPQLVAFRLEQDRETLMDTTLAAIKSRFLDEKTLPTVNNKQRFFQLADDDCDALESLDALISRCQ